MKRAVEPAVVGGLQAGSARLHEILRVEVRAGGIGRSRGVHNGQVPLLPKRLEWRERRMQAKESVEIDHRLARDVDARTHGVILRFTVRNYDVQPVRRATLEDHDEPVVA